MSVRRTIVFSDETDRALRAYLGQRGMQKGDISKFIEEAVAEGLVRRILRKEDVSSEEARELLEKAVKQLNRDGFEATVTRIKARTKDLGEDEIMSLIVGSGNLDDEEALGLAEHLVKRARQEETRVPEAEAPTPDEVRRRRG